MSLAHTWILAARPKTLPAGICPVILGSCLAYKEGFFNPLLFFVTLLTALGIQISTNFANDYFDYIKGADTEKRKGPTRITQAGLVSLSTIKKAILLSLTITGLLGLYLVIGGGMMIAIPLAFSLILAVSYTGGPYPLAYLGLGDLFVLIFFGPVATLGTFWIQSHTLSWQALLAGCGVGLLSTAILAVNNLRDKEEDLLANKKTLIVRFGAFFGKMEYLACLGFASFLPFFFFSSHPFTLLSLLFLIPAFFSIRTVFSYKDSKDLNKILADTGKILLIYTTFFSLGWIL